MSTLDKAYQPGAVETKWYDTWCKAGCFEGKIDDKRESFCIMIPPPNVTGVLTMGHVLNNTIQDVLVRRARQQRKSALWLPGTDHAGLATQTKVEQQLHKEGTSKEALGREAFIKRAEAWRDQHGGIIIDQLKRLGTSCDWSVCVHTLDESYSKGVLTAFVRLYNKGYIYRGQRMINWCPASLTALSDEEVFSRTVKSFLYKVRYAIVEYPGEFLEICTQRPETIAGDVALAVHPDDDRYKRYIGCHVVRPLITAQLPIIADAAVDPEFGTGILKVTPAHDPLDFAIGQRHGLAAIDTLNPDGTLNHLAGSELEGMDRFKARERVGEILEAAGLLVAKSPYESNIGYSERGNVPVEPRISEQWFLKYPRIEEAKAVVREGLIKFHPERWVKTYLHWLDNIQDWCISRQIWWGHRIPVWYKKGADRKDPANWHVSVTGPQDSENWEQDADTLDTWASSWIWPFATLGWPEAQQEAKLGLNYWYPTSDLVTGPDIIFFWVARMIVAALEFIGDDKPGALPLEDCRKRIPFKNVYFTGIIRDAQGRKMSKSLGNSPDPLDLIAQYGSDGLRFGVLSMAPQGQDILFQENGIAAGRNFCNKLWNAARFREMYGERIASESGTIAAITQRIELAKLDSDDHAILGRLIQATADVQRHLDNYEFSLATQALYGFFWGDYCDWYLEVSKSRLQDAALKPHLLAIQDFVLRQVLLLLHPFAPFITEELWHACGYAAKSTDFIQNQPVIADDALFQGLQQCGITLDPLAIELMEQMRALVTAARALKAQYKLQSSKDVVFSLDLVTDKQATLAQNKSKLLRLIGAKAIETCSGEAGPATVTAWGTLTLQLDSAMDVAQEHARLQKELQRLEKALLAGSSKLESPEFVERAPATIIEGARKQLAETQARYDEIKRLLEKTG